MTGVQRMESDSTLLRSEVRASRAIGSIFFTIFGAAWLVFWCMQAYGAALSILLVIVAVAGSLLLFSSRQYRKNESAYRASRDTSRRRSQSRVFNIVNAAQWVIIIGSAEVLTRINRSIWIVPLVIFTIGAHFIPLGIVFKSKARHVIGIALMLVALTYPNFTNAGAASPLGALCAGLILWAGAIGSLLPYDGSSEVAENE
jgi:hypothetical protein